MDYNGMQQLQQHDQQQQDLGGQQQNGGYQQQPAGYPSMEAPSPQAYSPEQNGGGGIYNVYYTYAIPIPLYNKYSNNFFLTEPTGQYPK